MPKTERSAIFAEGETQSQQYKSLIISCSGFVLHTLSLKIDDKCINNLR